MANVFDVLRRRLGRKKRNEGLPLLVFKEFEGSVNLIEDYDHIARNFLGKIREVVPLPKLILLVHDADMGRFTLAAFANAAEEEVRSISFPRNSRLVRWLKVNETYLEISRRSGVLEYLTSRETEILDALGVEMCFPLISMNRLIGILLVGKKPGGKPFTKLEISFISSLLPQAGIALENALLFREQRQRLRRMSRADKLATVGELAAGAAHEIRNPLTAIRSSLQYLESKGPDETSRKLLASALQETERIDGIVSALLAFARPSEISKERHDLRETIEESLELVSFQARTQKVAVSKAVPPAPLLIRADRAQLKQLFLNVFLNAIQAMPAGGTMNVEVRIKDERKAFVTVTDTGEGIPEEKLDRIFDPFFTTKKGGTGLGLSICYNIVKSHQGDIEVKSKAGQGTTILITLPLY
ncbi:MAG: ATP-binding protein [Candidatus Aminicenantes bacterium]|nr:ATP-binding protein [Candidatus Aminicenantes bacterium]